MLTIAIFSVLFAGGRAVSVALTGEKQQQPSCKAMPNGPDWPAEEKWAELNGEASGRLIRPWPAAAACHSGHPAYDPDACSEITDNWTSSLFHAEHPTSSLWTNVNNYSCFTDPNSPCTTDGYPLYVLNATDAEQIRIAINWARKHNVRVNVKSTGHDFLGRSTQPNSLSIWVHYLQSLAFNKDGFQPQGCNFTIPGPSLTAGGGTQMAKINGFLRQFSMNVVAGASNTVSVGGYVTGGGHGVLSGQYGLAADNVLEVEVVTPGGEILTANECQNQDLFWATRGGGGGTFGVMTKLTMAAFPAVPRATWRGTLRGPAGSDEFWSAIAAYHAAWAKYLAPVGCTGYTNGNPHGSSSLSVSVNLPGAASRDDLQTLMDDVIRETIAAGGTGVSMTGSTSWRATEAVREPEQAFTLPGSNPFAAEKRFPGNGRNKLITSWLYGHAELTHANLKTALMGSVDADSLLYQDFTSGPGVHRPRFMRGGGNAVNPGWRTAIVRPAAELQWSGTDRRKLAKRKDDLLKMGASLRLLGPEMGTYCNEADVDMPNAQKAFWGANYPRLLSIKQKMDPSGVFYCRSCVGSELWRETENGGLCRR